MSESTHEPDHFSDPIMSPEDMGGSSHWIAAERLGRVVRLPISVIVTLAEKKIELGQLREIGPGAILSFEKSCEDLLDLYVNNRLYCRGEAVKIGEKFGLKINEVGSVQERVSALVGPDD